MQHSVRGTRNVGDLWEESRNANHGANGHVTDTARGPLRIAFLHPDLGLGGAERLVVDAAAELSARGHSVHIYTSHFDTQRCFREANSGVFRVIVAGAWFPRQIVGLLTALCACIRCAIAACAMAQATWRGVPGTPYDAVVVDQVAAVVPLLAVILRTRILFYCHFPDLLLSSHRAGRSSNSTRRRVSLLRSLYRAPLDWVEERATGCADGVLVNSIFTRSTFADTFPTLAARGCVPRVLYPAVAMPSSDSLASARHAWRVELPSHVAALLARGPTFLSINRFERKKGVELAVSALQELHAGDYNSAIGLVVAGGYDLRVAENVEYLQELRALVKQLGVQDDVAFLPSFTDRQRECLLAACTAVLYTPQNEHFGIVPLEAMAAGRTVIACDSGGPLETVRHGVTGYLCPPEPAAFAARMREVLHTGDALGAEARRFVAHSFARPQFGERLERELLRLVSKPGFPAVNGKES